MRIREITPRIGGTVTLKQPENSYFLPDGLADGETVKLLAQEYRTMIVEKDGQQWSISSLCVIHEYLYEVGDRWLPKNHPRVLAENQIEERRVAWRKKHPPRVSFADVK